MEFSLITKNMKRSLYILTSIMVLFFAVLFTLMIRQDINNDEVNVLWYIIMGTVVGVIVLVGFAIQKSDWSDKNGKLTINKIGVEFRGRALVHFIPWEKVEYVIIGGRNPYLVINIQTDKQRQKYEKGGIEFPYYEWNLVSPEITSDDLVYVPYSQDALDEIRKHYKKQIINEYLLHMRRGIW